MVRREAARGAKGARARTVRPPAGGVLVDEQQRRRLAECCAFFMAARHRPRRPGGYRKQDLIDAEASIDAIIEKHKPK